MEIEIIPACSDKKLFLDLAKDYVEELSQYDHMIRWDERSWESIMWMADLIVESGTVQGFAVTQVVSFDDSYDVLYIAEFYIIPEARTCGVGMAAVNAVVSGWHRDVFLYILKKNITARAFWDAVEDRFEWKQISRPEIRKESGCFLRVYRTK